MNAYWRQHPPMHLLLQAYVGHKPSAETTDGHATTELERAEIASIDAQFDDIDIEALQRHERESVSAEV